MIDGLVLTLIQQFAVKVVVLNNGTLAS